VSQSTVSRAVARVEAELGRPLFVRVGRSLQAAPDAAPVFADLQRVVDEWDRAITRARQATQAELRVFCTVTASQLIAPPLFERFRALRPDVRVDLRTGSAGSALSLVVDTSVDVAIAPLPERLPRGLVSAALRTTPFVAVALRSIRSFDGQSIVLSRQGLLRDVSERWLRSALGAAVSVAEAETNEEVLALAAMGSGIAIVPRLVVEASPLKSRVHELTVRVPLPMITVGLVAKRASITTEPLHDLWSLA
jgi:LysR family transcriptional regulator, positive regulator for ilvC